MTDRPICCPSLLSPTLYILQALGSIHLNPALALAPIPVSSLPVVYRSLRGSDQVTPAEQEEVRRAVTCWLLVVVGIVPAGLRVIVCQRSCQFRLTASQAAAPILTERPCAPLLDSRCCS